MQNTLILLSAVILFAARAASSQDVAPPSSVPDAISKLADEDFHVRESASRWLWNAGKAAEPALYHALKSQDAEVAWRAQNILDNFRYGILPGTPAEIAELLIAYRDADVVGRNTLLESVPNPPPVNQLKALLMLASLETDKELKQVLESKISQIPPEGVMNLIAVNEPALAEQVLTYAALAGDDNAMQNLGALLVMNGGIAKKIQSLETGQGTAAEKKLLVYLRKVTGDSQVLSLDADAREQAMLEQHNWRGLADAISGQLQQNDEYVERLAILAACQRLSGRVQDSQHTIGLIRQCANDSTDEGVVRRCARAMLVNNRPAEALEILLEKEVLDDAFKLLCAQSRHEDAFALVERIPNPGPLMARLKIAMAAALVELGEKEQAVRQLDEAGQILRERPRYEILLQLVSAEREMGRQSQAFEHCVAAIRLNPVGVAEETLMHLFGTSDPEVSKRRVSLATRWWQQVANKFDDAETRLRTVKSIVDQSISLDEFETLANECIQTAEQNSSANNSEDEGLCLVLIAETWIAFGRQEKGQEFFERAVKSRRNVEAALAGLANLASERKQWIRAAEFYRQAWEKDFSNAAALYLRGWALSQSGQERAGKTCMDRASVLPLSEPVRRKALAEVLNRLKHTKLAREQDEMMVRVSGEATATANVLKDRYENLVASGDFSQAADVLQRRVFQALLHSEPICCTDRSLSEAAQIHQWRALAALRSENKDDAGAELRISLESRAPDVELASVIVPEYQKHGMHREARELIDRAVTAQNRVLERFPNSQAHQAQLKKLERLATGLTANKQ